MFSYPPVKFHPPGVRTVSEGTSRGGNRVRRGANDKTLGGVLLQSQWPNLK